MRNLRGTKPRNSAAQKRILLCARNNTHTPLSALEALCHMLNSAQKSSSSFASMSAELGFFAAGA